MSIVHRFDKGGAGFQWQDVEGEPIEMEGVASAVKHILIGKNEDAPHFIMRYIELDPGGHSRLEQHAHEHEVIVLRGNGVVQIGDQKYAVSPFDAVFIEGNALHQFTNPSGQPFGFICVIPRLD